MIITITCSDGDIQTDERILCKCNTYKLFNEDTKSLIFPLATFSKENVEKFLDFVVDENKVCIDSIKIANYLEYKNLVRPHLIEEKIFKYQNYKKYNYFKQIDYNYSSIIDVYEKYYKYKDIYHVETGNDYDGHIGLYISKIKKCAYVSENDEGYKMCLDNFIYSKNSGYNEQFTKMFGKDRRDIKPEKFYLCYCLEQWSFDIDKESTNCKN